MTTGSRDEPVSDDVDRLIMSFDYHISVVRDRIASEEAHLVSLRKGRTEAVIASLAERGGRP